jgi:plasmid stability protein
MLVMPTLYVRNVRPEHYEALRARAQREGRSVNAELLVILEEVAEREAQQVRVAERLSALAQGFDLKPGDPLPEDVVREGRDEWDRETSP